jgi:predicted nucleotidyltransferase
MRPHHTESIQRVTDYFERDPEVLALLLGGSIAHGFEIPASDVDIMIFVSDEDHKKRLAENRIHFFNTELTAYEGGYVDGKYSTQAFVKQVIEKGSEPARFAFAGCQVLFSKMDDLKMIFVKLRNIQLRIDQNASNVSTSLEASVLP